MSYRNLMIYRGRPGEQPFTDETVTDPPHDHPDAAGRRPPAARARGRSARRADESGQHPCSLTTPSTRLASRRESRRRTRSGSGDRARRPASRSSPSSTDLKGAIISAVDLVRGVGVLAGWTRIDVPGATGYLDTDYAAKGRFAVQALEDHDIVCVHVEAPDEASHEGRTDAKVEALERIDRDIVGPVRDGTRIARSMADPDLARPLDPAAHPRPRPCARWPGPWPAPGCRPPGNTYDEVSARERGRPLLSTQGYRLMRRSST